MKGLGVPRLCAACLFLSTCIALPSSAPVLSGVSSRKLPVTFSSAALLSFRHSESSALKDAEQQSRLTLVTKNSFRLALALLAGWADVACFRRFECFGNMMTGNLIKMATAVAGENWQDAGFFGLLIVYYVCGVCAFRSLDLSLPQYSEKFVALPILLLCAATDILSLSFPSARWHMFLVAVAFGAVNGVSAGKVSAVTCMMTGHMQKLGNDLADLAVRGRAVTQFKPLLNLGILLCFFAGLVSGAAVVRHGLLPPRFPVFTFLGVCYSLLLLLLNVQIVVQRKRRKSGTGQEQSEADCWRAGCDCSEKSHQVPVFDRPSVAVGNTGPR